MIVGHLTELDCRWSTISQSVDDRTPFERGNTTLIMPDDENLVGMGKRRISKSRYSSISRYLGKCFSASELQNMKDLHDPNAFDEEVYGWCIQHGFDEILAAHIAYLYIRDPLVVLDTTLGEQDPLNMVSTLYIRFSLVSISNYCFVCLYFFLLFASVFFHFLHLPIELV